MPTQNFFYRKDGLLKKIDLGDIVFIEAANNYSKFLTPDGFIMVRVTLDAALNLLDSDAYPACFSVLRSALEHHVVDLLLFLGDRYQQVFTGVSAGDWMSNV